MSTDYNGGMIVGRFGSEIEEPWDYDGGLAAFAEEQGMDSMCLFYDADADDRCYGFEVPDVLVSELEGPWLADVKAKAAQFEAIFGVPAQLIGSQDIR